MCTIILISRHITELSTSCFEEELQKADGNLGEKKSEVEVGNVIWKSFASGEL